MGIAELKEREKKLVIHSIFHCYGDAASAEIAAEIARDIGERWNEPAATIRYRSRTYEVVFDIEALYVPDLQPETVWYNTDPSLNFFRIEEYAHTDISFTDGLNCNTGYFKLGNLLNNSTTAAHEFGHTLGLPHPTVLDIRGQGVPGIMYPRGTICDPPFQYDPNAAPLAPGGTMNPAFRRVLPSDIEGLKLHRLSFVNGTAVVGDFSSVYHNKHEV